MRKILLVGGDSFSDPTCKSYKGTDIITWPQLLAEKLDMDLVCVAQSGGGNEQIYSSILDWICENGSNNIGLVLAAWSKCERMDWEQGFNDIFGFKLDHGCWHNNRVFPKGNIYSWLRKSIRNFYNLQILCENHNIPYKQFQMISFFGDHISEYYGHDFKNKRMNIIECIMTSPQFDLIKKSNFIGWPIYDEHDGFVVSDVTVHKEWKTVHKLTNNKKNSNYYYKANEVNTDYVVSPYDPHPNKKGHEMIMEFIYENL